MISWKKLELCEECLNQLDYDDPRGWDLVRRRNKGRRKMILKALLLPEPVTYKELAEIWNVSTSCIRQVEFRADKHGIIHNSIGKLSFEKAKIVENARVFLDAILKAKPQASKGTYMKKITITSTMGPGIKLDKTRIIE